MTEKYGYRDLLMESLGNSCSLCQSDEDLEIDHIKPRSEGGEHSISNIQLLCDKCYRDKIARENGTYKSSSKRQTSILHISNNLRTCRVNLKHHRQEDVASSMGMTRATYAGFEIGLFLPKLSMLDSLTDFFKCEPLDLYNSEVLYIISSESEN